MRRPSREEFYLYLTLSLLLDLLFVAIYGGSNWLNSLRHEHFSFYAPWELGIPLVPAMIYPYLSIGLLFLLPLAVLNSAQMVVLAKRMALAIIIAGIIFIVFPTELGFQRPQELGTAYKEFYLIHVLDRPYNLFPSLHITLSSVVLVMLLTYAAAWSRPILLIWWLILCLSVVLVHQHHLADIAGGLLLAWAVQSFVSHAEVSEPIAIED